MTREGEIPTPFFRITLDKMDTNLFGSRATETALSP